MRYRYIVDDEIESSIYNTKKLAIKEYKRLISINYKYKNSLQVFRHNLIKDEYTRIEV